MYSNLKWGLHISLSLGFNSLTNDRKKDVVDLSYLYFVKAPIVFSVFLDETAMLYKSLLHNNIHVLITQVSSIANN